MRFYVIISSAHILSESRPISLKKLLVSNVWHWMNCYTYFGMDGDCKSHFGHFMKYLQHILNWLRGANYSPIQVLTTYLVFWWGTLTMMSPAMVPARLQPAEDTLVPKSLSSAAKHWRNATGLFNFTLRKFPSKSRKFTALLSVWPDQPLKLDLE